MPKPSKRRATGGLILKAVIICDAPSIIAKAEAALLRVGRRSKVNAQWTITCWPANILNQARVAEEALLEVADAHLVIIPAQHAFSIPFGLRQWLERWAALRQIPDAALAIIGDGTHADFPKAVSSELTMLVLKHNLNLIVDESTSVGNATETAVRFPPERELPLQLGRIGQAVASDSLRGFGINE